VVTIAIVRRSLRAEAHVAAALVMPAWPEHRHTRSGLQVRTLGVVTLIGILACDHVSPELAGAARGRDYDDMYTEMLQAAEPSIRTRTYDVVNGELPHHPDECDAWIITGARYDAYRDEPWIVALRTFVTSVHEHRARLVGVCFGHQLVAHALGGKAEHTGTWKAGPQLLKVDDTAWFEGTSVTINAMHQDVASVVPPGGRTIATGDTAEHPMFLVDDNILCVQDHPEYDAAYIAGLVEARRPRMGDAIADAALDRIDTDDVDNQIVGRWITDFLLDRRR
jgi:GMP synthase-like glutamine amidotransferase